MTWKSYALVSGVLSVATWLAAAPPSSMPVNVAPAQPRAAANVTAVASDIEQQAAHLQARLQQEAFYRQPNRNLFRFADRPAPARTPVVIERAAQLPPAPVVPPQPRITLSGLAEDEQAAGMVRTAILSTPSGVVLAQVGDEVLGLYRVASVDEDGVDLTVIADGTGLRLTLATPNSQLPTPKAP